MSSCQRLNRLIANLQSELDLIKDEEFHSKQSPDKWSWQEIVGHLCDSAANNHIRFVKIMLSDNPVKLEGYDQDRWVEMHDYQNNYGKPDIIQVWVSLNRQISNVFMRLTEEDYAKKCILNSGEEVSMEWLVTDYFDHMLHHFKQILGREKVEQAEHL